MSNVWWEDFVYFFIQELFGGQDQFWGFFFWGKEVDKVVFFINLEFKVWQGIEDGMFEVFIFLQCLLGFYLVCDIFNRIDNVFRLAINIFDNIDEQVVLYLVAFFMVQLLFKLINSVVLFKCMYQFFKELFVNVQVVECFMGEFLFGVVQQLRGYFIDFLNVFIYIVE